MDTGKLVAMANQIAAFFRAYPEAQARAGIRDHVEAFWSRRMSEALMAGGPLPGLDPLVRRALFSDAGGDSPIEKEVAGPGAAGALASDAG